MSAKINILKNKPGEKFVPTVRHGEKVIKKKKIQTGTPVKIFAEKGIMTGKSDDVLKPIIENGEIVGVVHQCSCGKVTEIKFEFEEE